uniref:Uncharacterized protein n=1 Tax=Molossus molossus TaxID=27622 RepID=A0A7J8E2X6_MOLMO|nr:hypothetical protein HJG59_008981 [Molossus molossus]
MLVSIATWGGLDTRSSYLQSPLQRQAEPWMKAPPCLPGTAASGLREALTRVNWVTTGRSTCYAHQRPDQISLPDTLGWNLGRVDRTSLKTAERVRRSLRGVQTDPQDPAGGPGRPRPGIS